MNIDVTITQALLIFVVAFIAYCGDVLGTTFIDIPLVTSLFVGLIFHNLKDALIIGATLQMIWMGFMGIGAAVPPDVTSGGILGCAFALQTGSGVEVALTLALPIATLGMLAKNVLYGIVIPWMTHISDRECEKGNLELSANMHLIACFTKVFVLALLVAVSYYFGSGVMEGVLNAIPEVLIKGIEAATYLIPAVGIAMLLTINFNKKVAPFFFVGFVLAAYLKMDMLSIAIIGGALGAIMFIILNEINQHSSISVKGDIDDDEF